jgi:uncharacterized protein (TIGR02217 family)
MTFHNVRLDPDYERGARGGPRFKTTITVLSSGHEQRNGDWQQSRGEWNIGYGIRKQEDYQALLEFFLARNGRLFGFRFKDWLDYIAVDENLGTGDGTITQFQLRKQYEPAGFVYNRPITKPVMGTVVVKLDGVETSAFTIDHATGVVTFSSPPGAGVVVTASFEFDVPVRFDEDDLEVALQYVDAGSIPNVNIVELRQDLVELNP